MLGERFGTWTVTGSAQTFSCGSIGVMCRCECGTSRPVRASLLRRGLSRNCGCLRRPSMAARARRHGHTAHGMVSPEHATWNSMLERCRNPKLRAYAAYGGRGITVCDRWLSFENFLADMGPRPEGKTIDRVNVDGNYEESNCRWATLAEQARNKRTNRKHLFMGEMLIAADIATRAGIPLRRLQKRLRIGWPIDRAVSEPPRRWPAEKQFKRKLVAA